MKVRQFSGYITLISKYDYIVPQDEIKFIISAPMFRAEIQSIEPEITLGGFSPGIYKTKIIFPAPDIIGEEPIMEEDYFVILPSNLLKSHRNEHLIKTLDERSVSYEAAIDAFNLLEIEKDEHNN